MNPNQPDGANRPTPLTDAEAAKHRVYDHAVNQYIEMQIVPASFARQLERETATLHAQIARMKQREGELVGALKTIASYDEHSKHGEGICPYGCDTPHIARAALQSVAKEGEQ